MTELTIVRTVEEMQSFIWELNRKIVQSIDVPDSDITTALRYQRDLNQHNLEQKGKRKPKSATASLPPQQKLNLEDL
jgi:hypothetical protein